jgi:hypothetical protein
MVSKRRRAGLTKVAILAAVVMAGSSPATAAPLIRGPHYNDHQLLGCNAAECSISFAQVPANRFLIVTGVTCYGLTKNASNIPRLAITAQGDLSRQQFLVPVFVGNRTSGSDTIREYVANDDVYYLVPASGFPRVKMSTFAGAGEVVSLNCSIAGLLKDS